MSFDVKYLKPTQSLSGKVTHITFLATQRDEVVFHLIQEDDFKCAVLGGDFAAPLAVLVEFRNGDSAVWEPWSKDEA